MESNMSEVIIFESEEVRIAVRPLEERQILFRVDAECFLSSFAAADFEVEMHRHIKAYIGEAFDVAARKRLAHYTIGLIDEYKRLGWIIV